MYSARLLSGGLVARNPILGQVRLPRPEPRQRYVEDWELREALLVANPMLRAHITLKLITGLRRGDMLRLRPSDWQNDGLHVRPHKTAKSSGVALVIECTLSLAAAIDSALAARSKDISPTIFCSRYGRSFISADGTAYAFDAAWARFMRRALAETALEERFQEKDLRKKVASDMPLEDARALLGHTSAATTRRHYRLRGERVKPHEPK